MIRLRRLNAQPFVVNSNLIETIESTPDTVITMTTGKKFIVEESEEEIIAKIINYRKQIMLPEEQ